MRIPVALVLAVFANCVAAGDDPPPPIEVGPEWKKIDYKMITHDSKKRETWRYQQAKFGAVLFVTRGECSPCNLKDMSSVRFFNEQPTESAILVQHGQHQAVHTLSTEALKHLSSSYILVTKTHGFGLYMTTIDSITARDHMKLQQELMRMVEAWEPE